ncbi:MAG: hypothetical protein U0797_26090 [Gemmataceae bacterium]
MDQLVRHCAFHGAVVLLIGLLGGLGFARAIRTGKNEVAWRVVHSGGAVAGVMLLSLAALLPLAALPTWAVALTVWALVGGTYLFVLGMVVAAVTGERGLERGGSRANRWVNRLYRAGTVASLLGGGLLVIGFGVGLVSP